MRSQSSRAIHKSPFFIDRNMASEFEVNLSPIALKSTDESQKKSIERLSTVDVADISGSNRLDFERDRDRIIHCRQFRKLAGKTQLLIAPYRGDIRTRLTHTLEVYQLSTSIARRFNLNIPAVEAIALGHDVGHTPFGHAGEEALHEKLKDIGGFHHAAHSVRTLDNSAYNFHLSNTEQTTGLNLTFAIREGILMHGWFNKKSTPYHFHPDNSLRWNLCKVNNKNYGSVEAQVVNIADEIAFLNHDIEDLALFGIDKILSDKIIQGFFSNHKTLLNSSGSLKQKFLNILKSDENIRVKTLVRDVTENSRAVINKTIALENYSGRLIDFSPEYRETINLFYKFFSECVYQDVRIKKKNEKGKECIDFLFNFFKELFINNEDLMPIHIKKDINEETPWWRNYFSALKETDYKLDKCDNMNNMEIASMLAAGDIVADLTDSEAINTTKSLSETASNSGMEYLDKILQTFPNSKQMKKSQQIQLNVEHELNELFSTGKN